MELTALLAEMETRQASDLHLVVGQPPVFRVAGRLTRREDGPVLDAGAMEALLLPHLSDPLRGALVHGRQDAEMTLRQGAGTFRFHVFRERDNLSAALRKVPNQVPALDDLNFTPEVRETLERLTKTTRGLIVVTGPSGSGKSTTCAALIETINRTRAERIVTLEDLIEYEFTSKQSLITQRVVGQDLNSFAEGLRSAFREDPDIVFVGELRDLETFGLALALAETGHLVFCTMHMNTASEAVKRLIESYPESNRENVRDLLARNLMAVIAQGLLPRVPNSGLHGRVPANEILIGTPRVRRMIAEGHDDLAVAMEAGRDAGMQTMDDAIVRLYERGEIAFDLAWNRLEDRGRVAPPAP